MIYEDKVLTPFTSETEEEATPEKEEATPEKPEGEKEVE